MKYWMVTCERGHCGTGHSTDIKFAIAAETLLHACNIAKKMPSVKHSRPIVCGKEISETEFIEYRQTSTYTRPQHHQMKSKRGRH